MKKSLWVISLILIGVFLLLVLLGTLTKDKIESNNDSLTETGKPNTDGISNFRGFSLSPTSYSPEDFANFLNIASENGEFITWAGDWDELKKENSPAKNLIGLSKQYNFKPIIITNLPDGNEESDYIATIKKFVEEDRILYIGLGNEINSNYKDSYTETFSKAYDEIKKVSPETQVFTIFQLEFMKRDSNWNLISKFQKADFISFTTYPIILYQIPSEIPENYYSEISQKTVKQTAFTEVGWPRKENQQIEFIKIFNAQTASLNPKFSIWPFLYDQNTKAPFNTMGFLEKEQKTSGSLEEWKNI